MWLAAPELMLSRRADGVIVDDFDNDGLLDVMISRLTTCANRCITSITTATAHSPTGPLQAGFSDQLGGLNMIQTDYNNDGCIEFPGAARRMGVSASQILASEQLRRNIHRRDCRSGLAEPALDTQTAVWADIDNDGFVDLIRRK